MHVLATAGHVDHGKSTLVRALTGMEPDRWAEERRRGMTLDLGFAWTTLSGGGTGDVTVAFVDVPGHERFVPTMLAGVGPVPAVLLVVAADEGWMPQSGEHLDALHALGVEHGLLVVTRSDLLDPELALDDAREHLAGTTLADVPAVAVSAATGAGLPELRAELAALVRRLPPPDPAADVRLWVDRAFTVRGAGTVVTGTLAAGTLRVDDELVLAPSGRRVSVRGLQSLGEPAQAVSPVARVAVNLRGVPKDAVARGDALLTPGAWLSTDVVDVRLAGDGEPHSQVVLHVGAAAVPARVRPLGADTARLQLATALPLRVGDRALLRDPGEHRVVGGVTVLDVRPPALRRRGAATARAGALDEVDGVPDGAGELRRRGLARVDELVAMGAPPPDDAPRAAGWAADPGALRDKARRLTDAVVAHAAAHPLEPGMPLETARRVAELPDARLIDLLLAQPSGARLVLRDGRVHAGAPRVVLPPAVARAVAAVRDDLRERPFAAPEADRLTGLGLGRAELAAAVKAGELLKVADGIVLAPGADQAAAERLAGLPAPFTLSQARQALDTTRRVAVPLMELLARRGVTRQLPDGTHVLGPS